jgi:hypothetical protein
MLIKFACIARVQTRTRQKEILLYFLFFEKKQFTLEKLLVSGIPVPQCFCLLLFSCSYLQFSLLQPFLQKCCEASGAVGYLGLDGLPLERKATGFVYVDVCFLVALFGVVLCLGAVDIHIDL